MGKSKILTNLKGSPVTIPNKLTTPSDRNSPISKEGMKQSKAMVGLGLSVNNNIVKPKEEPKLSSKSSPIETYNEQGELVKTLSPMDRAKYNINNAISDVKSKNYLKAAKNVGKAFLNVQDNTLEPMTQLAAKAVNTVSKSGGMIMKNLSSLDEEVTRKDFPKGQQKILDDILDKRKKGVSALNRTEYGSEYGFNKNKSTLSQIKNKLFDDREQLTNVIGNARINKTDKESTITDVYNFDKENTTKKYLDKAKKKINPNYRTNEDRDNMSIIERVAGMIKDKASGTPLDQAISGNLRSVGAKINYKK